MACSARESKIRTWNLTTLHASVLYTELTRRRCSRFVDITAHTISISQAALPFSSGTTGLSKGVMITHYNLVAGMTVLFGDNIVPEDAVVLNLLPFYHIYALVVMMGGCLHLGSKLVLLSRFEPNSFLKTLQDYKV